MIYGGIDAPNLVFDGVAEALAVPQSELRLFGCGQASSSGAWASLLPPQTTSTARQRARTAAACVKPRAV